MKKIIFLFLFPSLTLYCFGESIEPLPFFPMPSFGLGGNFATQTSMFGNSASSLEWEQADLGITKYRDYPEESLGDLLLEKGPVILLVIGIVTMIVGPILSATSEEDDGLYAGIVLFSIGVTATGGSLAWTLAR